MEKEFMNQESIIALLRGEGLAPVTKQDTSQLMISKKVIRCESGDTMIAGMGSDKKKDDQIHLVVDALHLCLQAEEKKNSLRLILGKRKDENEQTEVENAVALLIESIRQRIPLKIETEIDGIQTEIKAKSFADVPNRRIERWMKYMSEEKNVPEFAKDLENAIHDDLFKWYRSVTGKEWSGRVGGLQVCTMDPNGQRGELKVGRPGKNDNGPARKVFLNILKKESFTDMVFYRPQLDKVAAIIRLIAESRRNGSLRKYQTEHLIESYVISGQAKIDSKAGALKPICGDHPFQFPTLWAPSAKPRFVDALMCLGDIPYVVELKESQGTNLGQYCRHAITQAVLYREFVRKAEKVHPWFKKRGLDANECQAVVAFPKLIRTDRKQPILLRQLVLVGDALGVKIVEIRSFE